MNHNTCVSTLTLFLTKKEKKRCWEVLKLSADYLDIDCGKTIFPWTFPTKIFVYIQCSADKVKHLGSAGT